MKNIKFLLMAFAFITLLLHAKPAQGQFECDASMYSVLIDQNGDDVTVQVYNIYPFLCQSLGFYVQRISELDSDPGNYVRTCSELTLAVF